MRNVASWVRPILYSRTSPLTILQGFRIFHSKKVAVRFYPGTQPPPPKYHTSFNGLQLDNAKSHATSLKVSVCGGATLHGFPNNVG